MSDDSSDDTPQRKGGRARARSLSKEQRSEIARSAAKRRWAKINDRTSLPIMSHKGPLTIGEIAVEAYRLMDGRRLISKKGMADILGLQSTGGNTFLRSFTCTNQAESYFARLRRAEMGVHHRISGTYLSQYAGEMAWREDNRRKSNGVQYLMMTAAALAHPVSRMWKGYRQRRAATA